MEITQTQKMTTCSRCKRQSAVEAAFLKEKHFFGLVTRTYCPDCQMKRQTVNVIFQYLLLPVLGLLVYLIKPNYWLGEFFLFISIYIVFFFPIVLLHELAHAGVGQLLGFRVFAIVLGAGRSFYNGRFLGFNWDLRPLPVGGATILGGPPATSYRSRLFVTYLAGPLVHAAIAVASGLAWLILSLVGMNHLLESFLWVMIWGNLFTLAANLWPRKISTAFGPSGTDGWYLFNVFSMRADELEKHYASYYALEAMQACKRKDFPLATDWIEKGLHLYPTDQRLLNVSGYILSQMAEFTSARQVFIRALESAPALQPELKYLLLNNIAFSDLMLGDPGLLAQADDCSAQAYQHVPWEPAIIGTRGAVLVALGKFDEGIPLLKTSLAKSSEKRGKAIDACFIARGELRRGNISEAKKYLETARMLDPACLMINPLEMELKAG